MSENQAMYLGSFFCLVLILFAFRVNKSFAIINSVIFLLFSLLFYYGMFFNGKDEMSLGWLILLIGATLLQILIIGIYLGIKFFKK